MDNNRSVSDEIARVSIAARLVPMVSYTVAAFGGAFGAFSLWGAMNALKHAENAGIGAVSGALMEASVPVIVMLSTAVVSGIAGIVVAVVRLFVTAKKASPPFWFFIIPGLLGLLPAACFFAAQTMIFYAILDTSRSSGAGVAPLASTISLLNFAAMGTPFLCIPLFLTAALVPLRSKTGKKLGSLFFLLLYEMAMIILIVALVIRWQALNKAWYELGMLITPFS